jgi:hypothetical protein
MREVADIELERLEMACGHDPDKLAALDTYISLLSARDEARDDGDSAVSLAARGVGVMAALAELMSLLRNSNSCR